MADSPVTHIVADGIVAITIDDGKRNALTRRVVDDIDHAIDVAEDSHAAILLAGRPGTFTAGFDRNVLEEGHEKATELFSKGGWVWLRLLRHPRPVVMAATGHAIAGGAVMLCTADWRIAAAGDFKIGLNEVGVGLTLQGVPLELVRSRISPKHFTQATLLSRLYDPETAMEAGFVDSVAAPDAAIETARSMAERLAAMPAQPYATTKYQSRRMLADTLEKMMSTNKTTDIVSEFRG